MKIGFVATRNYMRFTVDGLLESILVILMILNCNSIYGRLATTTLYIEELTTIFAVLLFIICTKKTNVRNKTFFFLIGIGTISILYLIARYAISDKRNFILQFLVFLPCIVIYMSQKGAERKVLDIYKRFSDYIFIISTLSTTVWLLAEIVHVINPNVTANITWGTTHTVQGFYGLFFETQMENTFGLYLYRNTGIFCEAPMHSLVLTLALIYELFLKKEKSRTRIIILSLYILTTFSLTGILCIAIAFLLEYWQSMQSKKRIIRVLYYTLFYALILVAIISANYLINIKSSTGSYSVRMIDYIVGMRAWIDNPIFGKGYNVLSTFYEYKTSLMIDAGLHNSGMGFSNSLTAILGQGGLALAVVYLGGFLNLIIKRKTDMDKKSWSIMIMILMTTTIFHSRFIMFYYVALAYILAFDLNRSIFEVEHGKSRNYDVSRCA